MELSAKKLKPKKFPTALPDFALTDVHIKLLKHAKKKIKGELENYVCCAIDHGALNRDESGLKCDPKDARYAAYDLLKFIRRAIKNCVFFHSWQRMEMEINRTPTQIRKDRLAWIDFLIKEADRVEYDA